MPSKNTLLNIFLFSFIASILVNNYLQEFLLWFFLYLFISVVYINILLYNKLRLSLFIGYIFISLWFFLWSFISINNLNQIEYSKQFLEKKYLWTEKYELSIKDLYKKDENYSSYIVKIEKNQDSIVDKNIYWLVYIAPNYKLNKSDLISLNTQIFIIDNVDNFDYKNYMQSKNIYFKAYIYDFETISKGSGFLNNLEKFRNDLLDKIKIIYPRDEATLLSWILIWAREDIPKKLRENFNNSWTTHFIAVSWFNITILIIFLWYVFNFFPILIRSFLVIFFLVIFCVFVWMEASVVRAWIMWVLGYIISLLWRKQISLTILLLTAFFMLIYNPFYINYDVSFHLSFLAVIWILYFKDFFDKVFMFIPNILAVKESLSLTLSALVATLPITLFNFWQISLLAPLSNIAFAWTIPFIMIFWFISICLYMIFPTLWIIVWLFSFLLLKWDLVVVNFFWWLSQFILKLDLSLYSIYFETLYFIFLAFFIFIKNKKPY